MLDDTQGPWPSNLPQVSMHGLGDLPHPNTPVMISAVNESRYNSSAFNIPFICTSMFPILEAHSRQRIYTLLPSFSRIISIDGLGLHQYMNWFSSTPAVIYRPRKILLFILQQNFFLFENYVFQVWSGCKRVTVNINKGASWTQEQIRSTKNILQQ